MSYNLLGKFGFARDQARGWLAEPPPSWVRKARVRRSAALGVPFALGGCLTDFPPLRPLDSTGGESSETAASSSVSSSILSTEPSFDGGPDAESTDQSTSGPAPSGDSGTETATSSGDMPCGEGYVACGSTCVPGDSCCETSCEFPNGQGECRDEECVLLECDAEFYDCDGEADNGCEVGLPSADGPQTSVDNPLPVQRFSYSMGIDAIDHDAWQGIRRYNLHRPCPTCEVTEPPPGVPPVTPSTNRGGLPATRDLRGSFALAWNELGLWANVVVIDDEWATGDDVGEDDPRLYDNVMLIWDDAVGESDAGSGSDRILYAGIDGALRDWRVSVNGAAARVLGAGACRSIHLQLTSAYLFVGSGGAEPLTAGEQHGLNIGYNDFDWVLEDARIAERQHFVFGLPMTFSNADYFSGSRLLPQIELVEEP